MAISSPTNPKGGLAIMVAMGKKPSMDSKGDMADSDKDPDMDGDDDTSPETDTDHDEGKQYIVPPKGFRAPENVPVGGSFDTSARVKVEDDGRLCVEAIGGVSLAPKDDTQEVDEKDQMENDSSSNVPPDNIQSALKAQYQ